MLRGLFAEIILIDSDVALATAEAADISDASALARPARIVAGTYADAAAAQIAIVTAGAATRGAQSRLSVADDSARIVTACVTQLIAAGFDGIIIVAANPVDLMALVALRCSGLAAARVIGTGTLLDSCRLRQDIAADCGVAPASVDGWVLGEHGDGEVAIRSSVRVGGLPLDRFRPEPAAFDFDQVAVAVRDAAYQIIAGKGYTSFGVATAAVRICEAIVRDERVVLPVSSLLGGQLGITDLYLSLPCLLGAEGVEQILVPDLDDAELAALRRSADAMHAIIAGTPSIAALWRVS